MASWTGYANTAELLDRAMAELIGVATLIDLLDDASHPSMELYEASRTVQNAIVALRNWGRSRADDALAVRTVACP